MSSDAAPDPPTYLGVDRIADAFEQAWRDLEQAGKFDSPPELTAILDDVPAEDRDRLIEALIRLDRFYREKLDLAHDRQWYEKRLPQDPRAVAAAFDDENQRGPVGEDTTCTLEATIVQDSAGLSIDLPVASPGQNPRIRYFGDYELLDEIARGGMGVVYRARQISLDRCVALKMILGAEFASTESKARFQMEAESAGRLDHPHIVPIHDIGEHEGLPYFSMKFIDGETLSAKADELKQDTDRVIELVAKIADAVHHAHQRGIVHRDLKPGNVLLDSKGEPLLTDFGLARRSADSELTRTGAILGTPEYMPPEQARGEVATTASDVYSLGAILYRLLTGRTPHVGDSPLAVMRSITTDQITRPRELVPGLHRDLEAIALKCLASEPADRYTSAADLAQDLRNHRDTLPLIARPAGPIELIRIWVRQQFGNVRWVPAIASVVGGVSGFLMWWLGTEANMNVDSDLIQQIRPSDRAPLWWLDVPIPPIAAILLFLCLIVNLGLLVKLFIQPKTRTADAIAGFGVGLLTGIVCYIAGGGALLNAAAAGAWGSDLDLLLIGNQNPAYAELATSRRYPELGEIPRQHQARVLAARIHSHIRTVPLLVGWIGAPLMALAFAVAGMFQTVVAGDIARRGSAHRAADALKNSPSAGKPRSVIGFSYTAGQFEYPFFAVLLGYFVFVVFALGSQLILTGSTSTLDWQSDAIAAALILLALIAVAAHWVAWIRIPILAVGIIVGGGLVFRVLDDVSHRWQIAVKRGDVAAFARAAQIHDDPLTQLRLAESQRQLAFRYLPAHVDRAIPLLRSGIGLAVRTPPEGKWKNVRQQTIVDSQIALAQAYLITEDVQRAAPVLRNIRQWMDSQGNQHGNNFASLVSNVLRSASADVSGDAAQRAQWTRRLVGRLIPLLWPDPQNAERYADWLLSQQVWQLYGPFEPPPGTPQNAKISSKLLAMKPPIEETLTALSGDDDLPPAAASVTIGNDQSVHLGESLQPARHVLAYAVSRFNSDIDQTVTFRLGSDDGVAVWIDGRQVHHNDVNRGMRRGQDRFNVRLSSGPHVVVLKISQGAEDWGFVIDVVEQGDPTTESDDRPVVLWGPAIGVNNR